MKKILLSIALLSAVELALSQSGMLTTGLGYNASFVNAKSANFVIDRYNETRTWLSKPMEHITYMDGISWNATGTIGVFLIDFNYNHRATVISAEGDNGNGMMRRDIKVKDGSFGFGIGLNIIESNPTIGLGFDADIGRLSFKSRMYKPEISAEGNYEELDAILTSGGTVWIQTMIYGGDHGVGLAIRPYYHFDFSDYNYQWFNQSINPDTYHLDKDDQHDKLNHFGIQILCNLFSKG